MIAVLTERWWDNYLKFQIYINYNKQSQISPTGTNQENLVAIENVQMQVKTTQVA